MADDGRGLGTIRSHSADIDHTLLREAFGCFATGVAIITTLGAHGSPVGLTVNSFSSVSLDPPLILWSLSVHAPSLDAFRQHEGFAVNIMSEEAKDVVQQFARPSNDKFANVSWQRGNHGVPVLEEIVAVFECRTESRILKGDHEIYVGIVERFSRNKQHPLLFHHGRYKKLGADL